MININDGGPAFPKAGYAVIHPDGTAYAEDGEDGMSLRAWLAGQVAPALIHVATNSDLQDKDDPGNWNGAQIVASQAVFIADALLAELNKPISSP